MTVRGGAVRPGSTLAARVEALNAVAEDLAGELMLQPLLERILRRCTELMGCSAGSISSVDEAAGTYRKQADIGIRCQMGQVFPLGEGMTGEVVRRRGPVWFDRYDDVAGGHISAEDRATLKGVIGVPLEWRGRIIGACVVFSREESRKFDRADADLLRMFAKHATVALVNANSYEAAEERARLHAASAERERLLDEVHDLLAQGLDEMLSGLETAERLAPTDGELAHHLRQAQTSARDTVASIRRALLGAGVSPLDGHSLEDVLRSELGWAARARGLDARLVVAGTPVPLDPTLAQHVLRIAQEAITNIVRHSRANTVRVGLVHESASLSLLVQDDGEGFAAGQALHEPDENRTGLGLRRMSELAHAVGGSLSVDSMPGWGTSIRAWFPYQRTEAADDARVEVLVVAEQPMLRAGLSRLLAWSEPAFSVVCEAATTAEAIDSAAALRPAVAIVATDLAGGAMELIHALAETKPAPAVIAICPPGDHQAVVDLLLAGAHGCVETSADGAALARAVAAAARGESIVPRGEVWEGRLASDPNTEGLTAREREVRALVQQGLPDRAIAERLVIAVKTVEKHVGAVLRKTGARSRSELIAASHGHLS
ncbi:GAF domain-containing protein [Kribbella qitaiheensis]|uniref:hybrid sensor histidine kinase/response regulator n=1 Tax=Kribbella qitaiheensis TaxID=1544730 RepID=UPI0036070C15